MLRFNRLISFLTGYLVILIRGPHLEKIINLLTGSGLYIWDVQRLEPETLQLKVRAHGFFRIHEMMRKTGLRVKIGHKKGWPFLWRDLNRRKAFLIGAVAFIGALLYLSTFVLFIKVEGFRGDDRSRLLNNLAKRGLKPGVFRRELLKRKSLIEREIMIDTPGAVWLGISIRGVVAEVKVVKRKTAPQKIEACDIVAGRDGVISRLIAIRGVPAVKEGDSVAQGDLLISGTIWHNDPTDGNFVSEDVPAGGIVEARVWYDLSTIQPKIIWKPLYLKSQYTEYKLRWGHHLWTIGGFGKKGGGNYYFSRQRKRIFQGRNPVAVVELIKDTWRSVSWRRSRLTGAQIRRAAIGDIKAKVNRLGFSLQEVTQRAVWSDEGNFTKLTVTLEMTQDIAKILIRAPARSKGAH
jgi:similar to stage IV sporulation protein